MGNSPCPSRGDDHTEQQDPGFVHRALKRHYFAGNGDSTVKCVFVQSGIGSFEKPRHCRTPLKREHSARISKLNSRSRIRVRNIVPLLVSPAQRMRYQSGVRTESARVWRPSRKDEITEMCQSIFR